MHYFLDPDFNKQEGLLCPDESGHAVKSLRLKVGDEVQVGNGQGTKYICAVSGFKKHSLQLETKDELHHPKPIPHIGIAMAALKNAARYEWFVEKATELGVDEIIPLVTARTERPRLNISRLERIALAATKQSQRLYLPELCALTPFAEAIKTSASTKLIAHCIAERPRKEITDVLNETIGSSVILLVGPEGDFTPIEVETAVKAGFREVSLGAIRLRTETAGVFFAALTAALPKK